MKTTKNIIVLSLIVFSLMIVSAGTDSYKFEKTSTKFYLGDTLTQVTSQTLDDDEHPNFLKDGEYLNYYGSEKDYSQSITMGNNLVLENFSDHDYKDGEQTIGFKIDTNTEILTYRYTYSDEPEISKMEELKIYFLGKTYTFTEVSETLIKLEDTQGNYIILEDGKDINYSGEYADDLESFIYSNNGQMSEFGFTWVAEDDLFATEESDVTLPYFENIIFRFEGLTYYDSSDDDKDGWIGAVYLDSIYSEDKSLERDIDPIDDDDDEEDDNYDDNDNDDEDDDDEEDDNDDEEDSSDDYSNDNDSEKQNDESNEEQNKCDQKCLYQETCVPIGFRTTEKYCGIGYELLNQKTENLECANNFECDSNSCLDSKCIEKGFWSKLINFLRKLF